MKSARVLIGELGGTTRQRHRLNVADRLERRLQSYGALPPSPAPRPASSPRPATNSRRAPSERCRRRSCRWHRPCSRPARAPSTSLQLVGDDARGDVDVPARRMGRHDYGSACLDSPPLLVPMPTNKAKAPTSADNDRMEFLRVRAQPNSTFALGHVRKRRLAAARVRPLSEIFWPMLRPRPSVRAVRRAAAHRSRRPSGRRFGPEVGKPSVPKPDGNGEGRDGRSG